MNPANLIVGTAKGDYILDNKIWENHEMTEKNKIIESNKSHWNDHADLWFGTTALPKYGVKFVTEDELHLFGDVAGKKMLEICCGSGHSLKYHACGDRRMSTTGGYVENLSFREGNEESSEEARAEKARVYAEFDDCPRTGNLVEILRFTHFARVFKFSGQSNFGRKKEISHEIKVSVVMELV